MNYSGQDLYVAAASLRSDEGENPEYDRALVEMILRLTGEDIEVVKARMECNCVTGAADWSGSPNPSNPDNEWVCDDCGRVIKVEVPDGLN